MSISFATSREKNFTSSLSNGEWELIVFRIVGINDATLIVVCLISTTNDMGWGTPIGMGLAKGDMQK